MNREIFVCMNNLLLVASDKENQVKLKFHIDTRVRLMSRFIIAKRYRASCVHDSLRIEPV